MEQLVETRSMDTESETQNIKDALKKVLDKKASGEDISLDEFCKLVPRATRTEVVHILKKASGGEFVTGRRGRKSRFVIGRRSSKVASIGRPRSARLQEEAQASASNGNGAHQFELRVSVGGQITPIPIKLELGMVAA